MNLEIKKPVDLSWWQYLQWNISMCLRKNQQNTVYWTVACLCLKK